MKKLIALYVCCCLIIMAGPVLARAPVAGETLTSSINTINGQDNGGLPPPVTGAPQFLLAQDLTNPDAVAVKAKRVPRIVSGEALTATLNMINGQANGSFILGGTIPTVVFRVTGTTPNQATSIIYNVTNDYGNSWTGDVSIPITTDGSGNATTAAIAMPAAYMGYFRVDAHMADGTILYPTGSTIGTRPPGFITYAVMKNPDLRFKYDSSRTHFGVQDQMNSDQLSSTLAYLGVRWVGYLQQQWSVLEGSGPNTFSGTLPISSWNTTKSVTPTNAPWTTYNVFYFTATHTPGWAKGSPCGQFNNSDFCALNSAGVNELPSFASKYATAAKAQFPNQDRYYEISWESDGIAMNYPPLLQYYQLVYPAIHASDPQAIVVGPTMFPDSQKVLKNLDAAGSPRWSAVVDGVSMHTYVGWPTDAPVGFHTYPPDGPLTYFSEAIKNHQSIMTGFKGHSVPLIGTEGGYSAETFVSPFDPTNRVQVDDGLLKQAQGDVRQALIWLGEGAKFHTLFKIVDFWGAGGPAAERTHIQGAYYNLDPAHNVFGSTFLGPKPSVPAYSAMSRLVDGFDTTNGVIPGLTGTQNGYSWTRTVNKPGTIWAVWDYAATSTINVPVPAGAYTFCDWMGNCSAQTSNGSVPVQAGGRPYYLIQP